MSSSHKHSKVALRQMEVASMHETKDSDEEGFDGRKKKREAARVRDRDIESIRERQLEKSPES